MTVTQPASSTAPAKPTAPTAVEQWFPVGAWLPKYQWSKFLVADLVAAVSVAALLIPESMGYATVAGVPVQIGLYAAPLALIGYVLFGGSRLLVFAAAGSVAAVSASVVSGAAALHDLKLFTDRYGVEIALARLHTHARQSERLG